ncbi:peroxidase 4-like [Silene latifolia]|uniref:peroxidase 4-like n=1 Tax=Silene latifolia TaxID=37657 RepID=UPI003D78A324
MATIQALVFLVMVSVGITNAQLSANFYSSTCPKLMSTVQPVVRSAIKKEARMGASLLRLFFHDCFVNGCDGSILLDDTSSFTGEKTAKPNNGSVRGFEVIDQIKASVEKACPGVVSCADILAITARDSVVALGGPTWNVLLGRRDAKTASLSAANNNIPPPSSSLSALMTSFQNQGLSTTDLVALAGGHTIGQARCVSFRPHIYNDSNIDASFAKTRRSNCPSTTGSGDNNLAPLDLQTPTHFDNKYYNNLVNTKGLLHSDQQLFSGGSTNALVQTYNSNPSQFTKDFVAGMINMGNIQPLTGSNGEIRTNCRKTN